MCSMCVGVRICVWCVFSCVHVCLSKVCVTCQHVFDHELDLTRGKATGAHYKCLKEVCDFCLTIFVKVGAKKKNVYFIFR